MEAAFIRIVRVALWVISARLMGLACLAMTFALAVYVMMEPDWVRMSMAAFFALFVFIPVIVRESKNEKLRWKDESE